MEDTQNPMDLKAVAASLEKAIAKVFPTASDPVKPAPKCFQARDDSDESYDASRERAHLAKRHWKGEGSRKVPDKRNKRPTMTTPPPIPDDSSDVEREVHNWGSNV
ncbi:Hypothetical predicted protein [Pelobates cultripes]|uniref:Uncharacterized protein n=1 Tax=Pelobates cultripes TaxID=61616 RepID=A0AAD1RKB5_PELCU|nr:Hypothetical predicted protein [Pelobates cultripes]